MNKAKSEQHPITPPPELVQQLRNAAPPLGLNRETWIATQAARWGADQELDACVEWLPSDLTINGHRLRDARRPKPPSLAEQGLAALKRQAARSVPSLGATKDCEVIRAALERLQELEEGND